MDFDLDSDQRALVDAVHRILDRHGDVPQSARLSFHHYDDGLQRVLDAEGFLSAGSEIDALSGALVTYEVAKALPVVEVAISNLVAPFLLPGEALPAPVGLISGARAKPYRNLPFCRIALVDLGEDAGVITLDDAVAPVASVYGYPFGRVVDAQRWKEMRILEGKGALLRHRGRIALATEWAGVARAAVDFIVDYVKQRNAFGRPIGTFQAVQHRLAQCHQVAEAGRWLAFRAAWSGEPEDADLAACYVQHQTSRLMFDLHQFNGAMGVTTENSLHFWTYRLRALQSELGGSVSAALSLSDRYWGAPEDFKQEYSDHPRPANADA
jgi:alkylation response protein AidB-like acyl-CoA dehydrogenase